MLDEYFTYTKEVDPFSTYGQLKTKATIKLEDDSFKPNFNKEEFPLLNRLFRLLLAISNPIITTSYTTPTTESTTNSSSNESSSNIDTSAKTQYSYTNKEDWVKDMKAAYEKVLKEKGIDTKYVKDLVGQDALESGWGKHQSGKNNFGGIKGKGTIKATHEYSKSKGSYSTTAEFRDFDSLEDYARYKVELLSKSRYHAFDGGDFANNVAKGGYATSPTYADKLHKIINNVA